MNASIPCALGRLIHDRPDVEEVKRAGWVEHRILVVSPDDHRLTWMERQVLQGVGRKLYEGR